MERRAQKKLGVEPSLLGFGCMRFPTLEGGAIDEEQAMAMLDRAYQSGVNYFDTAYFYHNGKSEAFIGRALARYPRESYYLTSKLPTTLVHSLEDAKRIYAEQRERLQKDYLDFYLLHNLNGARWHEMLDTGVVDWCLERQAAGDFRHFGFSFHGSYEEFHEILTARSWDCCQIQLNYMDTEEQASLKGYRLTEELGVPLIIMEPVKGGSLAVALREVGEESGLTSVCPVSENLFSLEILTVDGHEKRGRYVPSHLHLNVTYLLEANDAEPLAVKPDENSAVGWFGLAEAVAASSEPWFRERIYTKLNAKLRARVN